ncbi:MAG: nuclear transport factor 2 family protein [Asgard group archaeon]|nr:nuclear transport factor 2 family protein [Asgard group archaeon]
MINLNIIWSFHLLELLPMKESEITGIMKSLDVFVEGLRLLNYEMISEIFYEKAISSGVMNGKIKHVYREHWREMAEQYIAEGKPLENAQAHYVIKSISIVGNAASVIVELAFGDEKEITDRYIDFYHMLKADGKWVIMNKIFPTNLQK